MTVKDYKEWYDRFPAFIGNACMQQPEKAKYILDKANEINLLHKSESSNFGITNKMEEWDSSTISEFIQLVLKIEDKIADLFRFLK